MNRATRRIAIAAVLTGLALVASPARAEIREGFDVENFKPTLDPFGYGAVNGAKSLDYKQAHIQLWANWAKNALQFTPTVPVANGRNIVRNLTMLDLGGAVGVLPIGKSGGLQLGVNMPFVVEEDGLRIDNRNGRFHDQGFGQLRTDAKLTAFDRDSDAPVGLAFRGFVEWATAQERDLLSNNGKTSFGGTVIIEKRFAERWRISLETGYQYVSGTIHLAGTTIDDKLLISAGLAYEITDVWSVYGEIVQTARITSPYRKETEAPTEGGGGIKYSLGTYYFIFGAGGGFNNGVGSPDGRLFGALGITF